MKQPQIEFSTKEEIISLQEVKLLETLNYVSQKSKYYQRVFNEYKIDVNYISSTHIIHSPSLHMRVHLLESPFGY